MHRDSRNPDSETAALRLYLDESGGEDPGTPHSVIGGILIYRPAFELFEDAWSQMLRDHRIPDGIHMKEFGRRHGNLALMPDCSRRELLTEACKLIRQYRAVTMANTLSNDEYQAHVPEIARKRYSVYAMGFSLMVMMNHKLAEFNKYEDPIPIIMDSGNPKSGQVRRAHAFMQNKFQKVANLHLGGLTFDDDKVWGVLQAADIIAWGTRRRVSGVPFGFGFSPIDDLLSSDELHHTEVPWKREWLAEFGNNLALAVSQGKGLEEPTDKEIRESEIQIDLTRR
jgi:hypothetical protein